MSPVDFARGGGVPIWSWITDRIWGLERAFEHAKAQRREQDTTYRIFFVLMLFATAFATLACGAITAALVTGARDATGGPQ